LRGGQRCGAEKAGPFQEFAPVDPAVAILVIEVVLPAGRFPTV
jgi:hypothetical protein